MQALADTLPELAQQVGWLPSGDAPVAWYMCGDDEVIAGYEKWRQAHQAWIDRVTELMEFSGFPSPDRIRHAGSRQELVGIYADCDPPQWWRKDPKGYLVPRRRTKAEKASEVNQRFKKVQKIPTAVDYLPGMPDALWVQEHDKGSGMGHTIYIPQVRKPGQAVLVFLGGDPDNVDVFPFEPDPRWVRMKLSVYHALKERQAAGELHA